MCVNVHATALARMIALRDKHPPHRERSIGSTFQFLRQFVQAALLAIRFDVLERLIVYFCCAAIGFATLVGKSQNVLPVHLVVQRIETKAAPQKNATTPDGRHSKAQMENWDAKEHTGRGPRDDAQHAPVRQAIFVY